MAYRFLVLALLSTFALSAAAFAADEAAQPTEEQNAPAESATPVTEIAPEQDPAMIAHQESVEKVYAMMAALNEKLDEAGQKNFSLIYSNYNLVGTVKMVQGDVSTAIKKCGENNPDMKDKLDTRFKDWRGAIDPVIKQAEDKIDAMVKAQSYAKPKELRAIFSAIDDTRKKAQSRIEKIPVTTPEACGYLLEKMDETQESMLSLIQAVLVDKAEEEIQPAPEAEKAEEKPAENTEGQGDQ